MNTKIFIMAHKKGSFSYGEGYVPLSVGAALHEDLGCLRDDEGDNISEKNPHYSELTGLYWLSKHETETEYIGICHYRRFFFEETGKEILNPAEVENLLAHCDMITPPARDTGETVYEHYKDHHNAADLDETRKAVEKLCPEYLPEYDRVMKGSSTYICNMMICRRQVFVDYCNWLFPILFEVEKHLDISEYDMYNQRVFGFISERLLMVYTTHHRLRVHYLPAGVVKEKQETGELLTKISGLLLDNNWKEALMACRDMAEKRPDVYQGDSDFKGRLSRLYRILELRLLEEERGFTGSLWEETDFKKLLNHYYNIEEEMENMSRGMKTCEYLLNPALSVYSLKVICDSDGELADRDRMMVMAQAAETAAASGDSARAATLASLAMEYGKGLEGV